ncbi:MAG: 4Fe-4S binding protein [Verrucomicrobiales bacterium]|nr:4Fe-4S binding protein [Verrucomicrobiales bacterium]MCP5527638.1 4Fe-4S binding protein [Verrucomicrobiales bacterium]
MKRRPSGTTHWAFARRLSAACFLLLLGLGSWPGFPWFRGSMPATRWLDVVPFVDPLAAIEGALAARSLTTDMLIGAGMLVAAAAICGPVFCGWVCPLGLLFDLSAALRRRWPRGRMQTLPGVPHRGLGLGVLAFLAAFAWFGRLPLFQVVSPIGLVVQAVVFQAAGGLVLVALVLLIDGFWPRLWCRALCPSGALYFLISRRGRLRVRVNAASPCGSHCRQCTLRCPMGIRVLEDHVQRRQETVGDPQCIRCGACVESCPGGRLQLGWQPARPAVRNACPADP